ncbi:PREDICTED: cyclin-dependent kinase C-2-like isoform X1 [Camelina sativa]|uniref:Cyclin-dependent kinase C-2-like isoform X1 n=1 Tax=Camelina sativa TaxID=90675 RepID=A0ABM1R5D8_CAMSA|nr:PREDICTED: cyclin-dependent kinase C-2-like isoform X1 [Camelina sativa]
MAAAAFGQLNLEEPPPIWGSRSVDCFEKLEQIGEGTYGQVYMAKEIKTGEIVALKKIRMDNEREGFPITAIREIKILKKLHHENVIHLKEIVTSPGRDRDDQGQPDNNKYKGGIYMVFEYMDHDLTGLADRPGLRFTVPQIKCYMKQLLTGLHYCHVNQVLHRDIKGSNLLIDNEGNLKLANEQLTKIYELCGSPDENNWPGVSKMPWYNQMKSPRPLKRRVRELYRHFDRHALELLEKMLVLDPSQRISAKDALDAEYFWTDPLPCDPKSLPTYESSHEFQTKKKRQQMRHNEEAAKKQKLQHPQQQHSRLPPQQHGVGQSHAAPHWPAGPNHPMNNNVPPPQLPAGGPGSQYYGKPRGGAPGPNRYPPSGNQTGGYNNQSRGGYSSGSYPPQSRGAPYGAGPRPGGYSVGPPNYPQGGGQYGGSSGSGRGQNPMGGARNQHYGWQQ